MIPYFSPICIFAPSGTVYFRRSVMQRLAIALLLLSASWLIAQDAPRPRILGVAHIAIFAADYEKSRAFYRDFLGFEEPYSLAKPDGTPSLTFFKINERQYIELFPEASAHTDRQ